MVGLVRVAQDGSIIVGGRPTRFRLERGVPQHGPWLLIEANDEASIVRPFPTELAALLYVVGVVEN